MTDDEWMQALMAERFARVVEFLRNEHGLGDLPDSAVDLCIDVLAGVAS
jgi:hypothetical protein